MRIGTFKLSGFSLFGVLWVLTVASVIAGLSLPGLADLIAATRIRVESNALHHAIHLARRESIKRNRYVSLCKTRDGQACDTQAEWHDGWMVFVDSQQRWPPERLSTDPILYLRKPLQHVKIYSNRNAFSIRTLAYRTTNGTFLVCGSSAAAAAQALIVSYTGRPRQRPARDVNTRLACP